MFHRTGTPPATFGAGTPHPNSDYKGRSPLRDMFGSTRTRMLAMLSLLLAHCTLNFGSTAQVSFNLKLAAEAMRQGVPTSQIKRCQIKGSRTHVLLTFAREVIADGRIPGCCLQC